MHRSLCGALGVTIGLGCTARESSTDADSAIASESASATSGAVDSGAPKLLPRDEADAAFRPWRERALTALSRKDTAFLYSMLSPGIKVSFGPGGGIADFKDMWRPNDTTSGVWATLGRVLRMGGRQTTDSTFTAPYVFAFWPDSLDAFVYVAVTSVGAAVRTLPAEQSEPLGTATHSILRVLEWSSVPAIPASADTTWVRVELPDKRSGWIRGADVYSPVGWRAAFVRRGDQWIMVLFVAGD